MLTINDFDWYRIYKLQDFLDTGLVSKTFRFFLEDRGEIFVSLMRGNEVSIKLDHVLLPVELNGRNPYYDHDETNAVFKDSNGFIWLGYKI